MRETGFYSRQKHVTFLFSEVCRLVLCLGSAHFVGQEGGFSGVNWRGHEHMKSRLHLVQTLRILGAIPSLLLRGLGLMLN
jgi:hypothetical protein